MIKKICFGSLFLVNLYASDVVIDEDTDMMWQDSSTIVKKNYDNATRYCKNLSLEGYSDWRLPNIDELISISDKSRYSHAIKKIFKNTKNNWYWSSSKCKKYSYMAWFVDFYDGSDGSSSMIDTLYVRCIR